MSDRQEQMGVVHDEEKVYPEPAVDGLGGGVARLTVSSSNGTALGTIITIGRNEHGDNGGRAIAVVYRAQCGTRADNNTRPARQ